MYLYSTTALITRQAFPFKREIYPVLACRRAGVVCLVPVVSAFDTGLLVGKLLAEGSAFRYLFET